MTPDERCFLFLLARMTLRPRPPDHVIRANIARLEAAEARRRDEIIATIIERINQQCQT